MAGFPISGTIRPSSGYRGMASAVSTIFVATAFAYQSESRSIYATIASMSSIASGDQTRAQAIYQDEPSHLHVGEPPPCPHVRDHASPFRGRTGGTECPHNSRRPAISRVAS